MITSRIELLPLIDTSQKSYVRKTVHNFTIHFETPLDNDETLLAALEEDLSMV